MTNKYYPVWIGLALLLLLSATGCYSCGDLLPCHPNDPQFAPTQCPCLNDQGCPPHLLCHNQRCTTGASIEYPDTIGDTTNQDDHTQELSQDNDNQDNQKRDQAPDDIPPQIGYRQTALHQRRANRRKPDPHMQHKLRQRHRGLHQWTLA